MTTTEQARREILKRAENENTNSYHRTALGLSDQQARELCTADGWWYERCLDIQTIHVPHTPTWYTFKAGGHTLYLTPAEYEKAQAIQKPKGEGGGDAIILRDVRYQIAVWSNGAVDVSDSDGTLIGSADVSDMHAE